MMRAFATHIPFRKAASYMYIAVVYVLFKGPPPVIIKGAFKFCKADIV